MHDLPWLIILIIVASSVLRLLAGKSRRAWRVRSAKRAIRKLKTINDPARQFTYLRKIDPFVFEEMILTSLHELGFSIQRNKRYTGDGGIDGRAVIHGHKILIQAKRYSKHISAAHVNEFSAICRKSGKKGIFVHTGRTGKQAWINGQNPDIDIVSGSRLLKMITGFGFQSTWNS